MNTCHLITKSFDGGVEIIRRTVTFDGTPFVAGKSYLETITYDKDRVSEEALFRKSIDTGRQELVSSSVGNIVSNGSKIFPMSSICDFKVQPGSPLAGKVGVGSDFIHVLEEPSIQKELSEIATKMFPNINPKSGRIDVSGNEFFAPYIPLIVSTGCIPAQEADGVEYFNPDGVVTVAEFLDGLNAIKYGSNANNSRKKTLDNISTEADYFNEGYQALAHSISSPFFNMYRRSELLRPITRLELAYLTVVCWKPFMNKYRFYGNDYYLGINVDWEAPADVLDNYEDGFDYNVSRVSVDNERSITSLDIKDYMGGRTITQFKASVQSGESAIPLPMFMSLLELGVLDLFRYTGDRLDPIREVSRGEFCYFLTRIANEFPIKRRH